VCVYVWCPTLAASLMAVISIAKFMHAPAARAQSSVHPF
jgi:hypothetical protein